MSNLVIILPVSKVRPGPKYFGVTYFPEELKDERFVGELHFKGKWNFRYSPQENALTVMRAAFHDMHELALAVEQNDQRLADLKHFVGLASMVTPLLERFGFRVVHHRNQLGLPALGQSDQAEIKLLMRPVMACMIRREKLVEHKEDFTRASHR